MRNSQRRPQMSLRMQLQVMRTLARPGAAAPSAASSQTLGALESLGLISSQSGQARITLAGQAWLRRQLAKDDPFLEQHRVTRRHRLSGTPRAATVNVNDAESPLAWLRGRKDRRGVPMLSDEQFEAGERLRRDFTFAGMSPRVTADWSGTGGGNRHGASPAAAMRDDIVAARQRVHGAITSTGPELGRILMDVCCLLKGIESTERDMGLPQRSGKVVLQLALTALARHYGLLTVAMPSRRNGQPLHWGTPDFRPQL